MTQKLTRKLADTRDGLRSAHRWAAKVGKAAIVGVAGLAITFSTVLSAIQDGATELKNHVMHQPKKSGEAIEMKKSTVIALFVALAAIAGVLGVLYCYVLRREKELDEYEQLLFNEDFADDFIDDTVDMDIEAELEKA